MVGGINGLDVRPRTAVPFTEKHSDNVHKKLFVRNTLIIFNRFSIFQLFFYVEVLKILAFH